MNAAVEVAAPTLRERLATARVLPVITVRDVGETVDLVSALVAGGLHTVEITLRTEPGLEAIRRLVAERSDVVMGAGTITDERGYRDAAAAGASFGVSPGLTLELARAAGSGSMPLLPGVATPSEAMVAADHGFLLQKLFPAEVVGGRRLLRALRGPLPHLSFCPTGGLRSETWADYLLEPNVVCVGGSWMMPPALVEARDWSAITAEARRITS